MDDFITKPLDDFQPQTRHGIPLPPQVPIAVTARALLQGYDGDLERLINWVPRARLHCVVPYLIEQELWPAESFTQNFTVLTDLLQGISAVDRVAVVALLGDLPAVEDSLYLFTCGHLPWQKFQSGLDLVNSVRPNLAATLRHELEHPECPRWPSWWESWNKGLRQALQQGPFDCVARLQILYPSTSLSDLAQWLSEKEARETA